jgi:hypothetical protein
MIDTDIQTWRGHSMMKGHRYRITIEHLATPKGDAPLQPPLRFEAVNHDEILGIVARIRASAQYDEDEAAALGIGLKLFSEVMLKRRDDPLFAEIRPAMRAFIGGLKERNRSAADEAAPARPGV